MKPWPQKANNLRKVRALRRRIKTEVAAVNELAQEVGVPTEGRGVLAVLDDVEWVINERPGESPTYQEYRT